MDNLQIMKNAFIKAGITPDNFTKTSEKEDDEQEE